MSVPVQRKTLVCELEWAFGANQGVQVFNRADKNEQEDPARDFKMFEMSCGTMRRSIDSGPPPENENRWAGLDAIFDKVVELYPCPPGDPDCE